MHRNESETRRWYAALIGLALLSVMAMSSCPAKAAQPYPERIIQDMSPAQVRDALVLVCARAQAQIRQATETMVTCDKDPGVLATALLKTGAGPPPRLILQGTMAPMAQGTYVSLVTRLQTYTWTGAESLGDNSLSKRERSRLQAILDGLRPPQEQGSPPQARQPEQSTPPKSGGLTDAHSDQ